MSDTIDIRGLDKATVLAALYNAAAPAGLGFAQASLTPSEMTRVEARKLLEERQRFDYLNGRSFKVDLGHDDFDPWLYDRDNGGSGSAERIIKQVRQTGAVSSKNIVTNREDMTTQHENEQPDYAEFGETVAHLVRDHQQMLAELADDIPEPPSDMQPRQHLDWASDQALHFYDANPRKAVFVFLILVQMNPHTAWIASHPTTGMIMGIGMGSRHEMERMMKGFAA